MNSAINDHVKDHFNRKVTKCHTGKSFFFFLLFRMNHMDTTKMKEDTHLWGTQGVSEIQRGEENNNLRQKCAKKQPQHTRPPNIHRPGKEMCHCQGKGIHIPKLTKGIDVNAKWNSDAAAQQLSTAPACNAARHWNR